MSINRCHRSLRRCVMFVLAAFPLVSFLSADSGCDYALRPANAVEKKAYADAFALFQRMAPPAPAGWEFTDSAKDNIFEGEVCMAPGQNMIAFTFSRFFQQKEGVEQRDAETMKRAEEMAKKSEARQKTNEDRLTAIRKQEEELALKIGALAQAGKLNDAQALSEQIQKLQDEEQKLMGVAESDAENKAIESVARKDRNATFSLGVNVPDPGLSDAFKPMTIQTGKGYRQDYDDDYGNAVSDLVVLLKSGSGSGQLMVIQVSGDRARAEALLKATKLN